MKRSYYSGHRMMPPTPAAYPPCPCELAAEPTARSTEQTNCDGMVLAMAYVLAQPFADLYETDMGFARGTIFGQLDKPFLAGGVACE